MHDKRRRLNGPVSIQRYAYMTRSKHSATSSHSGPDDKAKKPPAHWTPADELFFCTYLLDHKAGAGDGNFKDATFEAVGKLLDERQESDGRMKRGGSKTVSVCKSKWSRIKETYSVVHGLMGKSGLAWSPDTGAGVNTDSPAEVHSVWRDIVAKTPKASPFANKGWPLYDLVHQLMPSGAKGKHVYQGSIAIQQAMAIKSAAVAHADPGGSRVGDAPVTSEDLSIEGWPDDDDRQVPPTLPPPTPSPAKRRFSTIAPESVDISTHSRISGPSTGISAHSRSAPSASSGSASKRGRMTGAIAISSLGNELSDLKGLLRMDIESTRSTVDAREERKRWEIERQDRLEQERSKQTVQQTPEDAPFAAIQRMQEVDSDLLPDDQATLADFFTEDVVSAKTYLVLTTEAVRKAWIQRKLRQLHSVSG